MNLYYLCVICIETIFNLYQTVVRVLSGGPIYYGGFGDMQRKWTVVDVVGNRLTLKLIDGYVTADGTYMETVIYMTTYCELVKETDVGIAYCGQRYRLSETPTTLPAIQDVPDECE